MDPSPYDIAMDEAAPSRDYQRRLEEQRLRNKDPIAAAATPLGASRKHLAETPDALPKKVATKRKKKSDWARNKPKKELEAKKRQREKQEMKQLLETRRAQEGLHVDEMDEDESGAVDDTVTFAPGTVETEEPPPKKPKVADFQKREATPEPEPAQEMAEPEPDSEPAEPELPESERAESEPAEPEPEEMAEPEPAEPEPAEPEPAEPERQAPEPEAEADAAPAPEGSAPCGLADLLLADADGHGDAPTPAPAPEALEASPKWPKVQPAGSPSAVPALAAAPAEHSVPPAPTLEPALEDVVKLPACRDDLREDERACYDALMHWAQEQAAELGVPAKQVMAPRTAAETVRLMPEKDDLLQAWGMSPKRIKQHGDAIMHVLEPFRTALRSR